MATKNQIGLDKTKSNTLADRLNILLADYMMFYQNTRGLHWNIKGEKFNIFKDNGGGMQDADFIDENNIVTVSGDGTVKFWPVYIEKIISEMNDSKNHKAYQLTKEDKELFDLNEKNE